MTARNQAGFTLLEVIVALAIMGMQLAVLLEIQASSLADAGRARDLTIASLLARSRMIDIEQELADEGFSLNETSEEGDFGDDGYPEIKYSQRIIPVELDLSLLGGLCGHLGEDTVATDCEAMLGAFGGALEGFAGEVGSSVRVVELEVTWPVGKYKENMKVRTLVTRDDYSLQEAPPAGTDPGIPGANVGAPPGTGARP